MGRAHRPDPAVRADPAPDRPAPDPRGDDAAGVSDAPGFEAEGPDARAHVRHARPHHPDDRSDPPLRRPAGGGHGGSHDPQHEGFQSAALRHVDGQAGHRARDRPRARPLAARHDDRVRRQPHLDPRRRRRHRVRHRHHAGARRARDAVPLDGQAEAAPGARGRRARQGRLREGRDPRDHQPARREGRRWLRVRVRRARDRSHDDGGAPHRLQHVDRGRRPLRLRQSGHDDDRLSARPAVRARGRPRSTRRPRGGSRLRPSRAPRSTTSRVSTAEPSSRW